jgi:hypothetical protein
MTGVSCLHCDEHYIVLKDRAITDERMPKAAT